jgi:hypothetical protein
LPTPMRLLFCGALPIDQPVGAATVNRLFGGVNVPLNTLNPRFVTGSMVSALAAPANPAERPIATKATDASLRVDAVIVSFLFLNVPPG